MYSGESVRVPARFRATTRMLCSAALAQAAGVYDHAPLVTTFKRRCHSQTRRSLLRVVLDSADFERSARVLFAIAEFGKSDASSAWAAFE